MPAWGSFGSKGRVISIGVGAGVVGGYAYGQYKKNKMDELKQQMDREKEKRDKMIFQGKKEKG